MRIARCVAAACGTAFVSVVAVAHADDEKARQRQISLRYQVYVGGIDAMTVRFDAALNETRYEMELRLATHGVAGWIFDWKMTADSHGLVHGGEVVPVESRTTSVWQGESRSRWLRYRPDGTVTAVLDPPRDDDAREPVPPALTRETRDLAGALLSALRAVGETGRCEHREAVFDGLRRYDITLEHRGTDRLRRSAYSPYGGPALVCRLRVRKIDGGRKEESGGRRVASAEWATVWLARVFEHAPPLPVRLDYELAFGNLTAHLGSATLVDRDSGKRLAIQR